MNEREARALAELDQMVREAREIAKLAKLSALLIAVLIMAAMLLGFNAPRPAHAATLDYSVGESSRDIGDSYLLQAAGR